MFTRLTILASLAVFALAAEPPRVRGQDGSDPTAKHWPLAKISFPVDIERVMAANPRPLSLRFYARTTSRGKFDLVADKKLDELDEIEDLNSRAKKRGFHYTSAADGRVDFALQYVYAGGETAPATANLSAQYKIVFDTRQPLARITTTGPRGVKWSIEDENLLPTGARLEVRSAGGTTWTTVLTREFAASDSYTWAPFDRNRVLEVRVVGKDRAGHEGVSNIVRISGDGGDVRQPDPRDPPPGGRIDTGFGGPDDFPTRPQIEYVNDKRLVVRSKPTRVTRSGIAKAVLWMKEQTGQWHAVGTNDKVNITLDDTDKEIAIPYEAKADGLYHFIIQPVNGAGQKPDDPRDGDPAHWIVEVDTTAPTVTLKGAKAVPGGLSGPRVEIDYAVVEKNQMPEPITIEYTTDPTYKNWTPIASKVPNTGKYVWEIEDPTVWKFHLRVTAVDRAANTGSDQSKEMITVDLETPSAVIDRIDTGGTGELKKNNFRPEDPARTIPPTALLPAPPPVKPDPPKVDPKPSNPPKGLPDPPQPKKSKPSGKSPTSVDLPDLPNAVPPGGVPEMAPLPAPGPPAALPPVPLPQIPGENK
jgi:hypothetical protein